MANEIGKRDQNSAVVLMGITDNASQEIRMLRVDPTTNRLLVSGTAGDVVGPASSTDNAIVRFDGTTGKLIQNSSAIIDDNGEITTTSIALSSQTKTFYVSTTGSNVTGDGTVGLPWATASYALTQANKYRGGDITINLGDGVFTETAALATPFHSHVTLQGTNTYSKTMSSVQSSSGGAAAWTIIINLNSVTNIAVGDYVVITAPTGGTLPTYMAGVFPVTNVDAVNTRITVTSKHANATAPSGAVSATVTVLKTILSFTNQTDGIRIWEQSYFIVGNMAIVGTDITHGQGITPQDVSRAYIQGTVGITTFNVGYGGYYDSEVNGVTLAITNCTDGLILVNNAAVDLTLLISGCTRGLTAGTSSSIQMEPISIITGNQIGITSNTSAGIDFITSAFVTGNTSQGINTASGGYVSSTLASLSTNLVDRVFPTSFTIVGNTDRPKLVSWATSSPYDQFNLFSQGSTGGWQGQVNLQTSYNGSSTPVTGLSVTSQTAGTVFVGIGNTAPAQKLDITSGNVKISDAQWMGGSLNNSWGLTSTGVTVGNTSASIYFNVDSDGSSTDQAFIIGKDRTGLSGGTELMRIQEDNTVGIGVSGPTAILHLKAGTTTASTAPLKFNTGTLLTAAEAGAVEFLTDSYYVTTTTGTIRRMIVAGNTGRVTGQTAAVASVAAYTLGASDASFEVSMNLLITTSTLFSFTAECAYTDEGNTARTVTLSFCNLAGAFVTTIANAAGAVPYEGVPLHIRCKASTSITLRTQAAGTYTTVTYNAEGVIKQIA